MYYVYHLESWSPTWSPYYPNPRGKPLSDATLSQLIKELGIAAVPHGFRSSFRDWAAERTSTPRDVVEAALAHTVQNPTEAAYARSDLFERRRRLMDDWTTYLSGAHEPVWHDDGNRAPDPGVLPTLQPTSRQSSKAGLSGRTSSCPPSRVERR